MINAVTVLSNQTHINVARAQMINAVTVLSNQTRIKFCEMSIYSKLHSHEMQNPNFP